MRFFPLLRISAASAAVASSMLIAFPLRSAEPLIIDDSAKFPAPPLYTEPIVAYRAFPAYVFVKAAEDDNPTIPATLISDAAKRVEELQRELARVGKTIETATMDELLSASTDVESVASYPIDDAYPLAPSFEDVFELTRKEAIIAKTDYYDPSFLIGTLSTEMIDKEFIRDRGNRVAFSDLQGIPVNRQFAVDVFRYYEHLNMVKSLKPQEGARFFAVADANLSKYVRFANSAKQVLGSVTVGRPIVLTAHEAALSIPESLTDDYELFVVVFAMSIKENFEFVDSVTFAVALPEQCIAYDLFPLRYDVELGVKEQISSPEVSIKTPGATVVFSSLFKREIAYSVLKPTIVAYGLQESQFAWSFRKDAAGMGSQRMAAIIAAPKGYGDVTAISSVLIETKDGILVEGSVAATAPRPHVLASVR